MVAGHLQIEQRVIQLFRLELPVDRQPRLIMYFQNYQQDDYAWRGNLYSYLGITYTGTSRSLDLDNQTSEITIGNSSAGGDVLKPVRSFFREHEGLTGSYVEITTMWLDTSGGQPYTERLQVSSATIDLEIKLTLESPLTAVDGTIPAVYFNRQRFKGLPLVRPGNI